MSTLRVGRISVCAIFLSVLFQARPALAATRNVPADYASIQAAIDASVAGDVVLVAAGTYAERLDFQGKAITVASASGPEVTTIDGGAAGSVITFQHGEPRTAILRGFTITNGNNWNGAGISISRSSPTLRGNIITGNSGCTGVGVYSYFSSPRVEGNTISRNVVSGCSGGWGIGVYIGGDSDAELISNTISENAGTDASGGGVGLFAAGRPLLRLNVIAGNATAATGGCGWGGGIAIANYINATIVNNLIAQNSACVGGAIYWINPASSGATTFVNNTIADNLASQQPGIYASGVGSVNRFVNNVISGPVGPVLFCVQTSWATAPAMDSNDTYSEAQSAYGGSCTSQTGVAGNISVAPGFVDSATGDYSIGFTSPLVDAGNNAAPFLPPVDLAGNPRVASAANMPDRIDIGAYEVYTQPPTANAGPDQTVTAGADCLAPVTLNGSGSDPAGLPLTYTWSGPFGVVTGATPTITLPAGVHTITLTVSNGQGGQATDTVVVTVKDVTPPTIQSLSATPSVIIKTTHEMVAVTVAASATDGCAGGVTCRIVSVSSNEPISGTGGGDLSPDWVITGDLTVQLRAERSPKGKGRIYTITVRCTDAAGNAATSTVTVTVPRR